MACLLSNLNQAMDFSFKLFQFSRYKNLFYLDMPRLISLNWIDISNIFIELLNNLYEYIQMYICFDELGYKKYIHSFSSWYYWSIHQGQLWYIWKYSAWYHEENITKSTYIVLELCITITKVISYTTIIWICDTPDPSLFFNNPVSYISDNSSN